MNSAARRISLAPTQYASLLPAAVAAVCWLAIFGASLAHTVGRRNLDVLLVCGGPALLALALAFTSQRDREQYLLRLAASVLMLPILMVFWATDEASAWPLVAHFALALAAFAAATAWLATRTTRLAPEAGRVAMPAAALGQRFGELARRLGVTALPQDPHHWHIDLSPMVPAGQAQVLRLTIDDTRREVVARERAGAVNIAPPDAAAASLRSVGDPAFDPTRPQAQRVSFTSVQVTLLTEQRLASVNLTLDGDHHVLRADQPQPMDHRDAVALFALLTTAAGYAWQPRLIA